MRPEKQSIADEVRKNVEGSVFVLLADYRGLSVSQTNDLRDKLSATKTRFQVVKNRTLNLVEPGLADGLTGPSAMVYGSGDVVTVAKTLRDFIKDNGLPVIKIGKLEGTILSAEDIKHLAGLPSREQLYAQVVGTLAAPMTQLVGVMNQKLCSLLYVLKAIQEKKEAA